MRLLTFRHGDRSALGALHDGWVIDATVAATLAGAKQPPSTLKGLIEAGPEAFGLVRRGVGEMGVRLTRDATGLRAAGAAFPEAEVQVEAPLVPGKIIAIGLNYWDHCREQHVEPPDRPIIFTKFPTTVIGTGETIEFSRSLTEQVDFEAELAVIIGKTARRVGEDEALDYVFGYTAGNDVTARNLQREDRQWVRGKSLDTFCPLGPAVVTADQLPDPQALGIRSVLNGEVMQESSTKEMIFSVRHLIAFASAAFTLLPGDLIMTGTPNGVGVFREPQVFMRDGDTIRVEIEGIGAIENPVRSVP